LKWKETVLLLLAMLAGQALGFFPTCECKAIDSHFDSDLEDSIATKIKTELQKNGCNAAQVIVVETATGKIKAKVAMRRMLDDHIVPFWDAFNEENTSMLTGPAYLALMESKKVTPEDTIDTEQGIYGEVRDHNWRRGGYGVISVEKGFACHSYIAMQKAIEKAYGNNFEVFEQRINGYLNGNPNNLMNLLTFYNAVANGGRMMKIVTEGSPVIINEQIASEEAIAMLRRGMEKTISEGILKKAKSELVDIACNGRSFAMNGRTNRMELCAYFPAQQPKYTVMVTVEKEGLPTSASTYCGTLLKYVVTRVLE
jgi:cell division protein FtsI (penicillin-binding protein 3)